MSKKFEITGTHYPENVFYYIHHYYESRNNYYKTFMRGGLDYIDILKTRGLYLVMIDICKNGRMLTEEQKLRFDEKLKELNLSDIETDIFEGRFQKSQEIWKVGCDYMQKYRENDGNYKFESRTKFLSDACVRNIIDKIVIEKIFKAHGLIEYILLGNSDHVYTEEYLRSLPVSELHFSDNSRPNMGLARGGFRTIGEAVDCIRNNPEKLYNIRSLGESSIHIILSVFTELGLLDESVTEKFIVKDTHYPENIYQYIHHYYKTHRKLDNLDKYEWIDVHSYNEILKYRHIYDVMIDICENGKRLTDEQVSRFEEKIGFIGIKPSDSAIINDHFKNKLRIIDIVDRVDRDETKIYEAGIYRIIDRVLLDTIFNNYAIMEYVFFGESCIQENRNNSVYTIGVLDDLTLHSLDKHGYHTIGDLVDCLKLDPESLFNVKLIGTASIDALTQLFQTYGLL
jgi:hypothetical protein